MKGTFIDEFITNKQIITNRDTVANFPFLETSIFEPVNKT